MGESLISADPGELAAFLNNAYADLRALHAVGVESPDYPAFSEEGLAAWFSDGAEVRVELSGGLPVCAMSWRRHPEQPVAEIGFIATAPAARRYGRASRLLRECEAWARGQGVEMLRTRPFVDSRYEPACRLLERCGFEVREPQHMNTTWEIDIRSWQPREPFLPEGYTLTWLCAEREADWTALHRAIFGSEATVEWFHRRFADQPNYDPQGWFLIDYDGRAVAMAGAIVWFEDAALARPSGALIEWVGVLPEERGRGLGEAVMVACLNYLKQRAVYPNCLITQYFREAAVGVYRKLGYHFVRECRTYQKRL